MNTVTLLGAEAIERAGYVMREAAHDMQRSVGNLADTLHQHQRFMDDWLNRFESTLESSRKGAVPNGCQEQTPSPR